jgi:hypothetical protein
VKCTESAGGFEIKAEPSDSNVITIAEEEVKNRMKVCVVGVVVVTERWIVVFCAVDLGWFQSRYSGGIL